MLNHNVPPLVVITEDEFAALHSQAVDGRYVDVQLSEGVMRLPNNALNQWVFPILARMRGLTASGDDD